MMRRGIAIVAAVVCGCYRGGVEEADPGGVETSTGGPPVTSANPPDDDGPDGDASAGAESESTAREESSSSSAMADETSTGDVPIDPLPSCPVVRSEIDRPDDDVGPQVKVIYAVPQDGIDEALDTNGKLCASVRAWASWFLDRSGGRGIRLDTAGGELDIAFVRLPSTNAQLHGSDMSGNPATDVAFVVNRIELDLTVTGWVQPDTIYAVYYGGTSQFACGQGAWPPVIPGVVGAFYLKAELVGFPACSEQPWGELDMVPRYVDYAMLHEVLHAMGFAAGNAPHMSTSAHVWDGPGLEGERDVLFSPPQDGGQYPPWGVYAEGGLLLDINHDDYMDHGVVGLPDLGMSAFLEPATADAVMPPCHGHGGSSCSVALAAPAVPIAVPPPAPR